jgi:hypothetical protein
MLLVAEVAVHQVDELADPGGQLLRSPFGVVEGLLDRV